MQVNNDFVMPPLCRWTCCSRLALALTLLHCKLVQCNGSTAVSLEPVIPMIEFQEHSFTKYMACGLLYTAGLQHTAIQHCTVTSHATVFGPTWASQWHWLAASYIARQPTIGTTLLGSGMPWLAAGCITFRVHLDRHRMWQATIYYMATEWHT